MWQHLRDRRWSTSRAGRCGRLGLVLCALVVMLSGANVALSEPVDLNADLARIRDLDYARVLTTYVGDDGRVDYDALSKDRARIDRYAETIAAISRSAYDAWNDAEKIAFWINAYNALTLIAIIDHYPIRPDKAKSLVYPANSIQQIPGVWDEITFRVIGDEVTLNQIEHSILRERFDEPRIHMALVCASVGCPPLRREPFGGAMLDEQLDDQTRAFLSLERNFSVDREAAVVRMSSIFDWFAGDFAGHGPEVVFEANVGKKKRHALRFIVGYVDRETRGYLLSQNYDVSYLPYDWSLNDRATSQ